jgi:hypothetical protein
MDLESLKAQHRQALRVQRSLQVHADMLRYRADEVETDARNLVIGLAKQIHAVEPDYLVDMDTL